MTIGLPTCTMVAAEPNSLVADIHDCTPVILTTKDASNWIDVSANAGGLHGLLVPCPPK